ncbi:hypothetical protein BD410DRAFT_829578 [Rickenella mellea]|uniref:Uncharacterized protein n=1 Tax=Rickenella mellea TaxID=50990 RepID=A0A4Y7PZC2_9AGAM|nr:hypothetical protein BD410DRAFT_829578 [Rickenella mellea]
MNIAQGEVWPDLSAVRTSTESNGQYYTPDFKKGVISAEPVWEDLKDTEAMIAELKDSRIYWSHSAMIEFAKGSFQSFKNAWKAQKDAAKANSDEASVLRMRMRTWVNWKRVSPVLHLVQQVSKRCRKRQYDRLSSLKW